jgi:hypothetical protein
LNLSGNGGMNIIEPNQDMNNSIEKLEGFDSISLGEMDAVKLLNRQDVKFTFPLCLLPGILENLKSEYRVLSIEGKRISRYETRYFDTPDLKMYIQHHNGKLNRHKVRFREYLDSGILFFEVKLKNNKGRTIKDRIRLEERDYTIHDETEDLLVRKTGFNAGMLKEILEVRYKRITLVRNNLMERVTFDLELNYKLDGQELTFPKLVIAEIKQDRTSRSPFTLLMQNTFIHKLSISKYCLGIACMHTDVKINNFKPKLLHVKKLCNSNP